MPEPLPAGLAAEELFAERIRALDDAARVGLLVAAAEPAADLRVLLRAAAELGASGTTCSTRRRRPA